MTHTILHEDRPTQHLSHDHESRLSTTWGFGRAVSIPHKESKILISAAACGNEPELGVEPRDGPILNGAMLNSRSTTVERHGLTLADWFNSYRRTIPVEWEPGESPNYSHNGGIIEKRDVLNSAAGQGNRPTCEVLWTLYKRLQTRRTSLD